MTTTFQPASTDTVTFYVTNLDTASSDTTIAEYQTAKTVLDPVSYNEVPVNFSVSAKTASLWFTYYLSIDNQDYIGMNDATAAAFPNNSTDSNTLTVVQYARMKEDYMRLSAKEIFGSEDAANYFTNRTYMETGYDNAQNAATASLNNKMKTTPADSVASVVADASRELVKEMVVHYSKRFALSYNAYVVPDGTVVNGITGTGEFTDGITTGANTTITTWRSGVLSSAVNAKITVKMSSPTVIQTLFITSTDSPFEAESGSGYVLGDTVVISDGTNILAIDNINPPQVAMLNGTLDDSVLYSLTKTAVIYDELIADSAVVGTTTGSFSTEAGISATGGSGSGAVLDVEMIPGNTTINRISIATAGSNYVLADEVTLNQGANVITITLNAADVELFNGVADSGTGIFTVGSAGTGTYAALGGSGAGDNATVEVKMTNDKEIYSIKIGVAGGSARYVAGDNITISDGLNIIKIDTITANQTAILNGAGYGLIVPTNVPVESGDKIRLKRTINGPSGQLNTNGIVITYNQSAYNDFQLIAPNPQTIV